MNKTTIDLDIVLPEVPDERDECVNRIIPNMSSKRGIEKVHIIPETETSKAQLCFHYNPYEVSLEKVQRLAEDAGIHWYRYTHGRCEKRCKRNWDNLMPEHKVEAIAKLRASEKKVAMVGDGVNDAPAMAKSTVGIVMVQQVQTLH